MMPGINPRMLKQAMKQLGMKQEEIDAEQVIIKCKDKELIIKNPSVMKINAMGQESLQITGEIEEKNNEKFSEEDIKTIIEQTGCNEKRAKKALEESDGDIAAAILNIKS